MRQQRGEGGSAGSDLASLEKARGDLTQDYPCSPRRSASLPFFRHAVVADAFIRLVCESRCRFARRTWRRRRDWRIQRRRSGRPTPSRPTRWRSARGRRCGGTGKRHKSRGSSRRKAQGRALCCRGKRGAAAIDRGGRRQGGLCPVVSPGDRAAARLLAAALAATQPGHTSPPLISDRDRGVRGSGCESR